MPTQKTKQSNCGVVTSVRGSVVDVRFADRLPPIYSLLRTGRTRESPSKCDVVDVHHVRGIALNPTQGLARGMAVEDSGEPLKAPVGERNSFANVRRFRKRHRPPAGASDVQWRTIHRDPPPLAGRSTKSEVFETGIKVIDVLVPLERGGKAGLFGGTGMGKTVLLTEMIHNMVGHQKGVSMFSASASTVAKAEKLTTI